MSRRKKYTLYHRVVEEMLECYSSGMPLKTVAQEFWIDHRTLRRLINEYETKYGPDSLRLKGNEARK